MMLSGNNERGPDARLELLGLDGIFFILVEHERAKGKERTETGSCKDRPLLYQI